MLLFVGLGNPTPNSENNRHNIGGSDAGHNGIASIDKFIGKDYSRVRISIGKPDNKISVSDYVLDNFSEEEQKKLEEITDNITECLSMLIDKKLDLFSSSVNNK